MAYYRILKRVDKGGPVGSLCQFEWLTDEQRQILIDLGVISRLAAPPLAELPGWTLRSERLAEMGIISGDQFLDCDVKAVAKKFRVKLSTVERWQDEVMNWLIIPIRQEPCCK